MRSSCGWFWRSLFFLYLCIKSLRCYLLKFHFPFDPDILELIGGLVWIQVIEFVKILSRKKGFIIVEQRDFMSVRRNAGSRSTNPYLTIQDTNADDLVMRLLTLSWFSPSNFVGIMLHSCD